MLGLSRDFRVCGLKISCSEFGVLYTGCQSTENYTVVELFVVLKSGVCIN